MREDRGLFRAREGQNRRSGCRPIAYRLIVPYRCPMPPYYRDWTAHARCAGAERDWELMDGDEFITMYCSHCPVRRMCFQEGFENQYEGVWGGTTKEWRDVLLLQYKMLWNANEKQFPKLVLLVEMTLASVQLME